MTRSTEELTELTVAEASAMIRAREISSVELARAYLERIDDVDTRVNAFAALTAGSAIAQAQALDAELADGHWRGPLHGIPIGLKDNIDTAGIPTTAASTLLAGRVPNADAHVYRRLRAAGAVLLGKLNMHEFAYGGTSAISAFGPVRNPWDLERIPGGSSGGSAAAVAARMCCAAVGTDTLASIRVPAAYCGIAGLKPTHGLVSIRGIIPVAETLDHVGPMARSALDCGLLLDAMAGFDPHDPGSIRAQVSDDGRAAGPATGRLRVGRPRSPYYDDLDPEIAAALERALEVIGTLAADVREAVLPPPPDFSVMLAESSVYHAPNLADPERRMRYHPVTLARLLAAGEIPTAAYIAVRREVAIARNVIDAVFADVDLLVTPTTPRLPELIRNAENPATASGAEVSVRNTAPFNLYGLPTISIPCGHSRSGLPIGLQITGPHLGEGAVLALAHAFEQATDWHSLRPPL